MNARHLSMSHLSMKHSHMPHFEHVSPERVSSRWVLGPSFGFNVLFNFGVRKITCWNATCWCVAWSDVIRHCVARSITDNHIEPPLTLHQCFPSFFIQPPPLLPKKFVWPIAQSLHCRIDFSRRTNLLAARYALRKRCHSHMLYESVGIIVPGNFSSKPSSLLSVRLNLCTQIAIKRLISVTK